LYFLEVISYMHSVYWCTEEE